MRPRLDVLISPGFVLGLAVLLANDFVLKSAWPGFVTGKLSDFAGLWVFAMFWAALLPRHAASLCALTAAAWVLWKSPAAGPAIDAWNAASIFDVARVVDYTDLLALAVLPASFAYFSRLRAIPPAAARPLLRRSSAALVLFATLFAFGATSSYDDYETYARDGVYYFSDEPNVVIARLNSLELDHNGRRFDTDVGRDCSLPFIGPSECVTASDLWIGVTSDFCGSSFDARIEFRDWGDGTRAALERIDHDCPRDRDDIRELQEIVEREIIEPLGGYGTPRQARLAGGESGAIVYDERTNASVSYELNAPAPVIIDRINDMGLSAEPRNFSPLLPGGDEVFALVLHSDVCPPTVVAHVLVRESAPGRAEVVLLEARGCAAVSTDRALFQLEFERRVIEPLRAPATE